MKATRPEDLSRIRRVVFEHNVTSAIGTLLQQKHLYQSVVVTGADTEHVFETDAGRPKLVPKVGAFALGAWTLEKPSPHPGPVCLFKPPDVKLFCVSCDRAEPYNLVFVNEVFQRIQLEGFQTKGETHQAFVLAYKCQSCKGTPELFLIRRRGFKLTNEGRSPIEHVAVPPFIPKEVRQFLSGAIVAQQSGQTLAGLFLLRTLLEQWARMSSGSQSQQADQVMEDYMATLPDDFKKRFPSMRTLYGDLSVDIHTATGSPELFEKAQTEIIEHFDGRRMFKLAKTAK